MAVSEQLQLVKCITGCGNTDQWPTQQVRVSLPGEEPKRYEDQTIYRGAWVCLRCWMRGWRVEHGQNKAFYLCPICASKGFQPSGGAGCVERDGCTFCDGTEGGVGPGTPNAS